MIHTGHQGVQRSDDICGCAGDLLDQGLTDEEVWDEDFDEDGSCPACGRRVVMPRLEEDEEEGDC